MVENADSIMEVEDSNFKSKELFDVAKGKEIHIDII